MKERKRVVVLFSGGLDSTYLIRKNLLKGNVVRPVYFNIQNNENKSLVEQQQIKLLINEFRNEFGYDYICDLSIVGDFMINTRFFNIVVFQQPLIWSSMIHFALISDDDEVQIGYTMNDDALSFIDEIKRHYYSASFCLSKKKAIPIKFPITKISKYEMLEELPQNYKRYITSCENPNLLNIAINDKKNDIRYRLFEPCGECDVCKKTIMNNYYNDDVLIRKYCNIVERKEKNKINYELKYKNIIPIGIFNEIKTEHNSIKSST